MKFAFKVPLSGYLNKLHYLICNIFSMKSAQKIPLIGPLFSFSGSVLLDSFRELLILWVFSSLPIAFSALSELPSKPLENWLNELLNVKVIFVYTTSFLSTVILLLINRVVFPRKEKIFYGATLIFCVSLGILLFSAYAYGNGSIDIKKYSTATYVIYALSMYFWLLAIADTKQVGSNFNEEAMSEEENFAKQAAERQARGNE